MASEAPSPKSSSSPWSQPPDLDGEDPEEITDKPRDDALSQGLKTGLEQATRLIGSGRAELERLVGRADLPEISGSDPMAALACRLDREADFWRAFALGSLARAAWSGRLAQITSIVAFSATIALALAGGMGSLFGAGEGASRALLLLAAVAAVGAGVAAVMWTSSSARRGGREAAQSALNRADLAERRLHRVAALLAIRETDPTAFREALTRLEHETGAGDR